jgi:hypothetical protein
VACASNYFVLPRSDKGKNIQSILLYYVCDFVSGELTDEGFDENEKIYSRFPEWIPIKDLDIKLADGRLGSSFDWRPLVKQAAKQRT